MAKSIRTRTSNGLGRILSVKKVLLMSHNIVGKAMAEPGIRYYNLARVLSDEFEVTLAMPCKPDPSLSKDLGKEQESHWKIQMQRLTHQYLIGDFYICASERQRDWWLGLLEANGRVNPWNIRKDPSQHSLIDMVPLGLPAFKLKYSFPTIWEV